MIEAKQRGTIKGHIFDERDKRILYRVERTIMVEMFGIDVGHHRNRAVEAQKAAIALIGLHHHPVARAQPRVGAIAIDDPAIDDGWVNPARIEQGRDHRGGRRLAVCARDRHRRFEPHQFGQHLRTPHHGQPAGIGGLDLRVIAPDRG